VRIPSEAPSGIATVHLSYPGKEDQVKPAVTEFDVP
jgi:hypothetical protein